MPKLHSISYKLFSFLSQVYWQFPRNYIPNLSNCYDFILWILKTGPKPENEEEKEVVKTLRGIIKENTHITEKGAVTWL